MAPATFSEELTQNHTLYHCKIQLLQTKVICQPLTNFLNLRLLRNFHWTSSYTNSKCSSSFESSAQRRITDLLLQPEVITETGHQNDWIRCHLGWETSYGASSQALEYITWPQLRNEIPLSSLISRFKTCPREKANIPVNSSTRTEHQQMKNQSAWMVRQEGRAKS